MVFQGLFFCAGRSEARVGNSLGNTRGVTLLGSPSRTVTARFFPKSPRYRHDAVSAGDNPAAFTLCPGASQVPFFPWETRLFSPHAMNATTTRTTPRGEQMKKTGARLGRPPKRKTETTALVSARTWPRDGMATMNDVAEFFQCSRKTVLKMIRERTLLATYVGSDRRIHWESVWQYANQANGNQPPAT